MSELNSLACLNLNLLVPLKALLEKQNVTGAAESLNLTQSTMSRHLAQLRQVFNDQLLVRVGKECALTPKALELSVMLDPLVDDLYHMFSSDFDPARNFREFLFAAPDYVSTYVLGEALTPLFLLDNKINISLLNWDNFSKQLLLAGDLHLAMSLDDDFSPNIYRKIVDDDRWVCLMRQGHPAVAGGEPLSLKKFVSYPFAAVRTGGGRDKPVDLALKEYGCKRDVRLHVAGYLPIFSILSNSDFLAVVPEHVARNALHARDLHYEPLPFKAPIMRYSIWWHERHHKDSAHRWLREVVIPNIISHPRHLGLSSYDEKGSILSPPVSG